MLTSSLDWARGTVCLWSMMWDLSWGDSKAEAWNHLAAHSLTLSGGWCLLSPKTLAEAFSQNAYVPSMWPGLSHMWWLGSKRSILRERATWKMHNPSWPGPGSYVVSRLPHSINWKYLRVPRLKVRRNRCPLSVQVARFWKSVWDQKSCCAIFGKYNRPQYMSSL